jgi:hypothetical protein
MTNKENVVKEHGSLATLVGCEKFGCPHNNLESDDYRTKDSTRRNKWK